MRAASPKTARHAPCATRVGGEESFVRGVGRASRQWLLGVAGGLGCGSRAVRSRPRGAAGEGDPYGSGNGNPGAKGVGCRSTHRVGQTTSRPGGQVKRPHSEGRAAEPGSSRRGQTTEALRGAPVTGVACPRPGCVPPAGLHAPSPVACPRPWRPTSGPGVQRPTLGPFRRCPQARFDRRQKLRRPFLDAPFLPSYALVDERLPTPRSSDRRGRRRRRWCRGRVRGAVGDCGGGSSGRGGGGGGRGRCGG